jgi:gamma-glutamyl phosphate reductase
MGHAEGICHVFVDSEADVSKAISVVVDSKIDYPAGLSSLPSFHPSFLLRIIHTISGLYLSFVACNAMETLLLHRETLQNGIAEQVLSSLRYAGVEILGLVNLLSFVFTLYHSFAALLCRSEECVKLGLTTSRVEDFSNEYSDLVVSLEIVDNEDKAIAHIHKYGR